MQIPYSSSPARAVIKEDFPQPGGPCNKYPRRYGIPTKITNVNKSNNLRSENLRPQILIYPSPIFTIYKL